MEILDIIIIILVIINFLGFLSALWVAYNEWVKEGKKDWQLFGMGLFFVPLCLFIAIMWPIVKYIEYIKKQKRERERKIQSEKTKKYHFEKYGFRLKDLPFTPSSGEIIFVENEYNEWINKLIIRNIDYIQSCFDTNRYVQPHFIYLPYLFKELADNQQSISYLAPYKEIRELIYNKELENSTLLDYMLVPENRKNIKPCFARYRGDENGYSLFECISFNPEKDVDEKGLFRALCSAFDFFPKPTGPAYQTVESKEKSGADEKFDKESKQLLSEVTERIHKLRKMGISQWALEQLVKPELKLSRLVITEDYKLLLPDYNNMEIKMEPLVKAIFLLFLNHPEGILFKHLPDYREELTKIYVKLKPMGLTQKTIQSIEDVTNPLLNSINEKCARIRGAFVGQFDDHLARHYYIDGKRGEAKRISLPRDLVIWEE